MPFLHNFSLSFLLPTVEVAEDTQKHCDIRTARTPTRAVTTAVKQITQVWSAARILIPNIFFNDISQLQLIK
jgi:hypothetical protein